LDAILASTGRSWDDLVSATLMNGLDLMKGRRLAFRA